MNNYLFSDNGLKEIKNGIRCKEKSEKKNRTKRRTKRTKRKTKKMMRIKT